MNKVTLLTNIENTPVRSAWQKGVKDYAFELVEGMELDYIESDMLEDHLLNGATDWKEYSYSGNAMIYDKDIAERLCTPTELKKSENGKNQPNKRETWLDVQARALLQAYILIKNTPNDN